MDFGTINTSRKHENERMKWANDVVGVLLHATEYVLEV